MGDTRKSRIAAAAAKITKNILGADIAKPATVRMPQAVSEIHVSPEDLIPAGAIITDELAELAGLEVGDLDDLEAGGHVKFIEVYAAPVAEA